MRARILQVAFLSLTVVVTGCGQRLNIEKIVTLEPEIPLAPIVVEGPKSDQKIKVEFNSTDGAIDVYVIVGKDENAIVNQLRKSVAGLDVKAKMEKAKDGILDATIPAGKDYGVYLSGAAKKTSVVVKVKSI